MKRPPKIEKGIPMPAKQRGAADFYPWEAMEVGDSFHIKGMQPARVSSLCYGASKRMAPKKFRSRATRGTGARVWRIA